MSMCQWTPFLELFMTLPTQERRPLMPKNTWYRPSCWGSLRRSKQTVVLHMPPRPSPMHQWGVKNHRTGIPYFPAGQDVIEQTHQSLRRVLGQQQCNTTANPSQIKLCKALFTINFFDCSFEQLNPPVV